MKDIAKALKPYGYEWLVSATGICGPGSIVVVFAGPGDFYTACLTHDNKVAWVMNCGMSEVDGSTDEFNELCAATRRTFAPSAQRQRLAFIGERLRSGGTVNRSDLIGKFGISAPQAATDFRNFSEAHPGAMKYDNRRKAYVPHNLVTMAGRDTTAAADRLMRADDAELEMIAHHDPSMIRDVAAALIYERAPQ